MVSANGENSVDSPVFSRCSTNVQCRSWPCNHLAKRDPSTVDLVSEGCQRVVIYLSSDLLVKLVERNSVDWKGLIEILFAEDSAV